MSYIDDKNDITKKINSIKTTISLKESKFSDALTSTESKYAKTLSSLNDAKEKSKNVIPFLLNLLKTTSAEIFKPKTPDEDIVEPDFTEEGDPKKKGFLQKYKNNKLNFGIKDTDKEPNKTLVEILNVFLPEVERIIKEGIVEAIKYSLNCGSDFAFPTNISLTIELETIDFNNILQSNPDGSVSGNIFFTNTPNDFNKFLYDLIQNPGVTDTWDGPNGPLLNLQYNNPNKLTISIPSNVKSFDDFIKDFIDSIGLMDKKMMVGGLIDSFFGNTSSNLDLSLDQLVAQEKTNALLDKVLDTDPCDEEGEITIFDDSFFSFSNEDLELLERKALEKKDGVTLIDLGCGIFEFNINNDTTNNNINQYLGFLDSNTDPQAQENTIKKIIDNVESLTSNQSPKNGDSIKNKINTDFIKEIPKVILNTVILTPKILLLFTLADFTVTGTQPTQKNSFDWSKANKVFFDYVSREIQASLVRIVLDKVVMKIKTLVANYAKELLGEQVSKKLKILSSYIAILRNAYSIGLSLIDKIPTNTVGGIDNNSGEC